MNGDVATKPVLIVLDGTSRALAAVPIGLELSTVLDVTPHIVYVGERELAPTELAGGIGLDRDQLDRFSVEQVVGDAASGILALAADYDATAIVAPTLLGSEVELEDEPSPLVAQIASRASCPLVLVACARGLAPWRVEEILVPYDGTPSTAVALAPAAKLADRASSHLFVLYVADSHTAPPAERGAITVPHYVDQPQHEWPAWAGEFLDRFTCMCDFDTSRLRLFVAHGHPGGEIVRFAREHGIDLIVVAWKGLHEPYRGTTAKEILKDAPCPVLVLRTDAVEGDSRCAPGGDARQAPSSSADR
jgi:nucleotide-binding universal stress UspA family protein